MTTSAAIGDLTQTIALRGPRDRSSYFRYEVDAFTATLLDLAVRGHLLITEQPRREHAVLDWSLEVTGDGAGLGPFEAELLAAIGPEPLLVCRLPQQLAGRRRALQDALYDEMPPGRELEVISSLLPYTVVLGGKQRWLAALVAADRDAEEPDPTTLSWYHAPGTWHLQDLPASLTQFTHTVQGALYSR